MFIALFLVVRGVPALLLYRGAIPVAARPGRPRLLLRDELPLVVAITTIAVEQGKMLSSTSAGLVGAAIISTLVFPLVALRIRRESEPEEVSKPTGTQPQPAG